MNHTLHKSTEIIRNFLEALIANYGLSTGNRLPNYHNEVIIISQHLLRFKRVEYFLFLFILSLRNIYKLTFSNATYYQHTNNE